MKNVAVKSFTAEQLRNLITGPDELALIDLREGGDTAVSGRFTMRPIRIAVPEAAAIAGDGSPAR